MDYEENDEGKRNDEDFMQDMREKFVISADVSSENRKLALEDIKFGLLGEQWNEKDAEKRRLKGKPCITINKFPAHIRQVVNDARQNKPAIRVRPVDDNSDPKTAEILNGLIRNIETSSNADIAYDTAIHQSVSGGFGYLRVNVDFAGDDTFDRDIKIERISNQFAVYEDPYANSADGSDWKCCWVTERITKAEFKSRFGNKDTVNWELTEDVEDYDWVNDDGVWIAEYWEREEVTKEICLLSDGDVVDEDVYEANADAYQAFGKTKIESRTTKSHKVTQYIVSGKEILETNEWAGRYIPIVPCYGEEVIVENKRYFKSLIRDSKDAQRLLNYWRTTTTELVALAPKTPFIGEEGAFSVDTAKWTTANTEDHAFIMHKKGTMPPQRQQYASVPAGAMQEALNADDDIKSTMGMFGASIGQADNAISGRAIMARQRESDTGTFHFIDNLSRSLRQVGRIIVDLVPHVYQPGRVLRIIGEDGKETENIRVAEQGAQLPPDISNVYDLTAGKYDVVVDVGPGFTTKRQEAATQMIEFSRVNPQASALISDLIAKNLDWPGATEISERFKAMLPPQITGENPQVQQLQQQLQAAQQQAQQVAQQLVQQLEQLKQDKSIDVEKVKIDAYNAETNRAKIMQAGMTPEQVQMLVVQTIQQLMQTPDITPGYEQQQAAMAQQQQIQPQQEIIQ